MRVRRLNGRQFGAACPKLQTSRAHGSWAFGVYLPSVDGKKVPRCRSGFHNQAAAVAALRQTLTNEKSGLDAQGDLTVAAYLTTWLRAKQELLRTHSSARTRPGADRHGERMLCDLAQDQALAISLPGIGSASAVRHSGAPKVSAKYCVSCTTCSCANSMMLTE